jgi:hypothetical protein
LQEPQAYACGSCSFERPSLWTIGSQIWQYDFFGTAPFATALFVFIRHSAGKVLNRRTNVSPSPGNPKVTS